MILNREQIDATYPGPLRDTALSYHDLRDAMLRLHHHDGRHGCATCIDPDGFPAPWPCQTSVEVARVERVVTTKRERLRPEGSPALGATYRDWRDFTDRVARPLVENDGDDDRIEKWHRVLMMEADDYYLAVALVMADNRIRELEAVARVERGGHDPVS